MINHCNEGQSSSRLNDCLVAVGGIGGSGTRLVIQIIEALGFYIGADLNKARDNLLFTLLFRRKNIFLDSEEIINNSFDILIKSLRGDECQSTTDIEFLRSLARAGRHDFSAQWFAERVASVIDQQIVKRRDPIAWKEPNTHVFLDRLLRHNSKVRYLHVVRDGLDMAFSKNQHQLAMWGDCYLNRPVVMSPSDSLCYWNAVHLRIMAQKKQFPCRIHFVRYDQICQGNEEELRKLYGFLGIHPALYSRESIDGLIQPPDSLGRASLHDAEQFNSDALKQYYEIITEMDAD